MKRRRPNKEELELWRQVARSATPLDRRHEAPVATKPASKDPFPTAPDPVQEAQPALEPFQIGERSTQTAPGAMATAKPAVQMDKKSFHRMKRGKLKPQATLDLHGMTVERAHNATIGFILRAASRDLRLVLVVTGKGKRGTEDEIIPQRRGVLRHQLPQWLSLPPLGPLVLEVSEAHNRHGGGGAYYVYLRRRR
ncbi:Smr/MutS family protein [Roseovarius nubinhibens]|uniref:Smr/MutS family protein n=1 Tax=Roseovarius nubinhibens TaxID=314263 RepID=UPI001C090887|nr:Smr/MutS family protein [Roseovarius nubinhibens]MBU2999302.1 Smr/MutS family protein [Roseovarius nubinhibens]